LSVHLFIPAVQSASEFGHALGVFVGHVVALAEILG
jgi:hypothetical protein